MRRFESGSYGKTVVYWLVGFCVFWLIGALYLSVESPPKSIQDKRAEFQMVFGAIVGIVATLRFVATEAWAQIVIDSEGITKITWRGKESILWNAITDYDTVISAKKPTYRLKEASGRTVRVILSYMGNHASELEAIIEAQIAHLKRKRLEELAEGKITLYPSRDEDIRSMRVIFVVCFLMLSDLALPTPQSPNNSSIDAIIELATIFAPFLLFMLYLYHRQLRIVEGILIDKSPFRTHKIALSQITALRYTGKKNATISSGSKQGNITISRQMTDYRLLMEYLSERCPHLSLVDKAQPPTDPQARAVWNRKNRVNVVIVWLMLLGMVVAIVGIRGYMLWQESILDNQSLPVTGQITKFTQNRVGYTYTIGNIAYVGNSLYVTQREHPLHIGDSIRVEYLPDNPQVSRAAISNRKGRAIGFLIIGGIQLALIFWGIYSKSKRGKPVNSGQ